MTTQSKAGIAIAAVAVVALIAVFAVRMHNANEAVSTATDESSLPTPASDTSDAALAKDSAAIDAELNALGDDSAAVDQGLAESQ